MKKKSYKKNAPKVNSGANHKKIGRGTVNLAKEGTDAYSTSYGKPSQAGY